MTELKISTSKGVHTACYVSQKERDLVVQEETYLIGYISFGSHCTENIFKMHVFGNFLLLEF